MNNEDDSYITEQQAKAYADARLAEDMKRDGLLTRFDSETGEWVEVGTIINVDFSAIEERVLALLDKQRDEAQVLIVGAGYAGRSFAAASAKLSGMFKTVVIDDVTQAFDKLSKVCRDAVLEIQEAPPSPRERLNTLRAIPPRNAHKHLPYHLARKEAKRNRSRK